MSANKTVLQHYGDGELATRVRAALEAAGPVDETLSSARFAPLDQFHSRGLAATVDLAKAASIDKSDRVLDIGSGLGGPSRYLASSFGCRVEGVDLSPSFVEVARYLALRAGLSDVVTYQCANALSLPFDNESFDVAWTQHVAMNIVDRARLYTEARRVLLPSGRFAIFDVVAGNGEPLHFPVPWSPTGETSFLLTSEAMRSALEEQGFRVVDWTDTTEAAIAWFDERRKEQAAAGPQEKGLGLDIVMGPDFPTMTANLSRNLREGRARLVQAVLQRT